MLAESAAGLCRRQHTTMLERQEFRLTAPHGLIPRAKLTLPLKAQKSRCAKAAGADDTGVARSRQCSIMVVRSKEKLGVNRISKQLPARPAMDRSPEFKVLV